MTMRLNPQALRFGQGITMQQLQQIFSVDEKGQLMIKAPAVIVNSKQLALTDPEGSVRIALRREASGGNIETYNKGGLPVAVLGAGTGENGRLTVHDKTLTSSAMMFATPQSGAFSLRSAYRREAANLFADANGYGRMELGTPQGDIFARLGYNTPQGPALGVVGKNNRGVALTPTGQQPYVLT
jgi:hypothetical protein